MQHLKTLLGGAILATACSATASDKLAITGFMMDTVEICDASDECKDLKLDALPDPKATPIPVLKKNPEGMLMFNHNNQEMWVHNTEVELNQKKDASVICTKKPSLPDSQQTFGSLGLGEGC